MTSDAGERFGRWQLVESHGSLYDHPRLYDILMTPGTARELDVFERIARRFGRGELRRTVWLEPACGTGRFLRLIASRGRRVVGFDSHVAQLAYARERLRRRGLQHRARLFRSDMTSFAGELGSNTVDFVFNPVNSIRHLASDGDMLSHFAQIALVLRPGGVYAVGISLTGESPSQPEEDVWVGVRGRCRVTQVVTYLPPEPQSGGARRERVISHLMVERPCGIEHLDSCYELRTYSEREWWRLLRRSDLGRVAVVDAKGRPLPTRGSPAVGRATLPGCVSSATASTDARSATSTPPGHLPYQIEVLAVRP